MDDNKTTKAAPAIQGNKKKNSAQIANADNTLAQFDIEQKYRLISENIKDVIWLLDVQEMKLIYVSPSIINLSGYTPEETISLAIEKTMTPDSFEKVTKLMKERIPIALQGKELPPDKTFEIQQICKDGSLKWVEISTSYILDEETGSVQVLGVSRDISERKIIEQSLLEKEKQLNTILELAPIAISILELDNYLYVNPAWLELTGYTREDMETLKPLTIVHPDMKDEIKERAEKRLCGEEVPGRYEMKAISKTGKTLWFDFMAIPIVFNTRPAILTVSQDITDYKAYEATLKENEEKFRVLSELSPVPISFLVEKNYLYVNPAWEKLSGFTKEEAKQLNPLRVVHPDMRDEISARMRDRFEGRVVPNRIEMKILTKNNEIKWVDLSAMTVEYQGKRAILTISPDVTENKIAKENLIESEKRFHSLFDNSGDALIITKDRKFQDCNPAAEVLFGYSKEDLIGLSTELIHVNNESYHKYGDIVYPSMAEESIARIEWPFRTKYGNELVMDTTLTKLPGGGTISIMKDITERKKTEAALKESEERLKSVFMASPMGIYIYKLESENKLILIAANPAADLHTKINNQEKIGLTIEEAFPPLAESEIPARYREAASKGTSWSTTQFAYQDGKIAGAFDVYAFQISANRMAVLFQDVTVQQQTLADLKTSEKKYRNLSEELMETNNLKELLLDVITHDLRNPATVIYNSAQLFEDDEPDKELLSIIKDSSTKLFNVIGNAKILAQVTSDEEIELSKKNICRLISDSLTEFLPILKAQNIEVHYDPANRCHIMANDILTQVFKNYISNVSKYASEGKRLDIDIYEDAESITVKFRDFGKTIEEAKREMIFERGIQLDNGKKTGRGLGLSISRRIAKAHKGKVWVEPNEPKGNAFCLKIPKADQ